MDKEKLYKELREAFGLDNQDNMFIEELCELAVKIRHLKRNKCNLIDVLKELSDVDILKEQFIINHDCQFMFDREKNAKLKRTAIRLKKGELN